MQPVAMQDMGMHSEDKLEDDKPDSAVAVLRYKMLFYRDQAETICEKIMEGLKDGKARADLMAMMYKYMNEANKICIDCAAKLAPYEAPRLEAVEVTQKQITKFVIEAPTLSSSPEEWLINTRKELKLITELKNNSNIIEGEIIPTN